MQVVILHYAAPPVVGGVERVIYYHATLLAKLGHTVHVVAGRGEQFAPGVVFHHLGLADSRHPEILTLKTSLDEGLVPDGFAPMRDRILSELTPILNGADVLIAHNILGLHKNLALTAALHKLVEQGNRLHLIAWHHDLAWKASRYLSEMHDGYPWNLLRQPWPNTLHVAVSEARRRDVAKLFQVPLEEVRVVPGGVDILSFLGLNPSIRGVFHRIDLMDSEPLLLLPARITRRKNVELAIHVTAALREEAFPKTALIVTGPPGPHNPDNVNYLSELKSLRSQLSLNDAVHFLTEELGETPGDAVMIALYHLSDALIFPSYEEGFGLPVLEAALTRLPIFCSDIPPLRELAGGRATYFMPEDDPNTVAQIIIQVLSADRATMLRRRVLNHYGWNHIIRRYVDPLLRKE